MSTPRELRAELVEHLRRQGLLEDARIERSFLGVARECFLPASAYGSELRRAYEDRPIVIKRDEMEAPTSSSSQPAIMAAMLTCLEVGPGDRVLEIGTGSGYNAAILSRLVGARGRVITVELDVELARRAEELIKGRYRGVEVATGDDRLGWPAGGPYDRVIATASVQVPPQAWHDQLLPSGLLVAPLHFEEPSELSCVVAFDRTSEGFVATRLLPGGFMSLRQPGVAGTPAPAQPRLSVADSTELPHRRLSAGVVGSDISAPPHGLD